MAIELKRIGWENSPSTKTPLNKTNLSQMEQNAEDAINELDTKVESNIQNITNIKARQTEQNNRLDSAETKNTDQDKLIEKLQQENTLLKSQIPTDTASGENITLTDSSNMPFEKFVVRGKSEQDGEPTHDNSIAIRNVGDDINLYAGELKSGLYTSATGAYVTNAVYVCSTEETEVKGGQTITVSNKNKKTGVYYVIELDENKAFIQSQNSVNVVESYSCKLSDTTKYILIDLGNSTSPCTIETVENFKVQEGSIATAYSPYGYGSVEIEKVNKNLFDGELSQGYDSKGTIISSNQFACNTDLIGVEEGKSYTISNNLNKKIVSMSYYKDNTFISFVSGLNSDTIEIPEGVNQIRFNLYDDTSLLVSDFTYLQVEEGTVATDYTPHQSETFIFPLAEGQVLHEGDKLADTIVSNKKTIILDGTENWVLLNADLGQFYLSGLGVKPSSSILCSHFVDCKAWQTENGIFVGSSGAIGLIYKGFTTLEELQNWLAENPITVEYELAEPVPIEYTEEQQIIYNNILNSNTYKNITHISAKGDVKPELDIEYYRDLDTVLNNLANAIVASI